MTCIQDVGEGDAAGLEYFLQKTPEFSKTSALCSHKSKKLEVCETRHGFFSFFKVWLRSKQE